MKKLRMKMTAGLVIAALTMGACSSPAASESKLQENVYKMPETDLQEWCGYYTRSGKTRDNGSVDMDFVFYEKDGLFWGYFSVERREYYKETADAYHQYKRILTTVQAHAGKIFVYFYEEIPIEGAAGSSVKGPEDCFGACARGDLLFTMKQEGEDILTAWEKPFLEETEESLSERRFHSLDLRYLSCMLLGEKDREAFLAARGISSQATPFFVYADEDSGRQLTVYTDEPRAGGTGIYCEGGRMQGIGIPSCSEETWVDERFVVTYCGDTGEQAVADYTESRTYNGQGQLACFLSEGTITDREEPCRDIVIEVTYSYREDGTLEKKEGFYNAWIFGSAGCSEFCIYDEQERPVYKSAYITHGRLDTYYIYLGEKVRPDYGLVLDFDGLVHAYELIHYTD